MMSILDDFMAFFRGRETTPAQSAARIPGFAQAPELKDLPEKTEAEGIIKQICSEAKDAAGPQVWRYNLSQSSRWQRLKDEPADLQIAVLFAAFEVTPQGSISYSGDSYAIKDLRASIVSQLLRRKLPFKEDQLIRLLRAWQAQRQLDWGVPGNALLGAFERLAATSPLSPPTTKALKQIKDRAVGPGMYGWGPNKTLQELGQRIGRLLDPAEAAEPSLPTGAFGEGLTKWLETQPQSTSWLEVFRLASKAGDKAKPSARWLAGIAAALKALEPETTTTQVLQWLADTTPDPARPDASLDILKGLIWASVQLDHAVIAGPLGRFAETCYRKVPQIGARSVKLGNAALWALSEMAGEPRAAAELIRLREKIKYPSARAVIDNRLDELAKKSGQSVQALEDLSLPDFGLDNDGRLVRTVGAARVELALSATELQVQWINGAGQPVKSPPAEIKRDEVAGLAAARTLIKDMEAARAGQVIRLEQSWIEGRDWAFDDWKTHVLGHALRRPLTTALIWCVDTGGNSVAVMPVGEALLDIGGVARSFPGHARVRLWHPLDADPAEVLAWRRRIVDAGLTQPIKQAHREIYVLTDAERATRIYSNRFAAHIMRQHQFRALCQARGWTYGLMGDWDGWNVPERRLPALGLRVQYQVETVEDGQRSESAVALHVATDQVRFLNATGETVALDEVPPVAFSEVLRDVDLFVAVASVANDPGWTDGGPEGRFGGYWREWAFGPLGQSAETRKDLITALVPRLSIRDKLEIGDKSLIVQGKWQKYAIHFGSGNIQILPSNRYLCIVPDGAPAEATNLRLPFAGDGLLSIILSKAFLLTDESRIKDETILRQL